jgi:hypothetical protein
MNEKNDNIGILASISWNSNKWAGESTEEDIEKSNYGYVKKEKHMHECLNFGHSIYPLENDNCYIGYTPMFESRFPKESVKIIFLFSSDYHDSKKKIVGFYGFPSLAKFSRTTEHELYKKYNSGNIKSLKENIFYFDNPIVIDEDTSSENFLPEGKEISKQSFNYLNSDNVHYLLDKGSELNRDNLELMKFIENIDLNDRKYWIFQHKPGEKAEQGDCETFVGRALELKCAFMQQEYGYQKSNMVTQNWNLIKKFKEGDYLFLRGGNKIYAFGEIIKPRIRENALLNMEKIINDNDHGEYLSGKSPVRIIHFYDNPVFYEDFLDGTQGWGQRVDVDFWKYYNKNGIEVKKMGLSSPIEGSNRAVIWEINKKVAEKIIKELKGVSMCKETQLLEVKCNLILTGAPGTGKTYRTAEIALQILGEAIPFDRKELMKAYNEAVDKGFITFTTFHQSMDYEEFVEGLKPDINQGIVHYSVKPGIFKRISQDAKDNPGKNYVLIIDEINRGNISKIFGELITLLEKDKRLGEENAIEVTLPYSQDKFGVPNNLYIIGTMNTADRSIGHIDYAIRRRFVFLSIKSDKRVIEKYDKYENDDVKEKAKNLFESIEKLIEENINSDLDAEDLMIGHSYFLCETLDELKDRLEYEIIPLVEEYNKDGIIIVEKKVLKEKFEEWKKNL